MKRLMISILLCCTPIAFGLIGELVDDIEHGVAHAAHATDNLLHRVGRHERLTLPNPSFQVEPRGVSVYLNNVASTNNGVLYQTKQINEHELELTHPGFIALFSFDTESNVLRVQLFAQQEEQQEVDFYSTAQFARISKEIDVMLKKPVDLTMPKIEYDEPARALKLFFSYK